jgi:hypothetical protein
MKDGAIMYIYHLDVISSYESTDTRLDEYISHPSQFTRSQFLNHIKEACTNLIAKRPDRLSFITGNLPYPFNVREIMDELIANFGYSFIALEQSIEIEEEYFKHQGWELKIIS